MKSENIENYGLHLNICLQKRVRELGIVYSTETN